MTHGAYTHRAKPFTWDNKTWPSLIAFCREYGLHPNTVRSRLKRGYTGMDLIARTRAIRRRK